MRPDLAPVLEKLRNRHLSEWVEVGAVRREPSDGLLGPRREPKPLEERAMGGEEAKPSLLGPRRESSEDQLAKTRKVEEAPTGEELGETPPEAEVHRDPGATQNPEAALGETPETNESEAQGIPVAEPAEQAKPKEKSQGVRREPKQKGFGKFGEQAQKQALNLGLGVLGRTLQGAGFSGGVSGAITESAGELVQTLLGGGEGGEGGGDQDLGGKLDQIIELLKQLVGQKPGATGPQGQQAPGSPLGGDVSSGMAGFAASAFTGRTTDKSNKDTSSNDMMDQLLNVLMRAAIRLAATAV